MQQLAPGTSQLIGFGLLMAGAAVCGKLVIDALVVDMAEAKKKRELIGPIQQIPKPTDVHVEFADVVRFSVACVSLWNLIVDLPALPQQIADFEKEYGIQ